MKEKDSSRSVDIVCFLLTFFFWQGVKAKGAPEQNKAEAEEGKGGSAASPTPAKREDVVFDVTDKNLQKVGCGGVCVTRGGSFNTCTAAAASSHQLTGRKNADS